MFQLGKNEEQKRTDDQTEKIRSKIELGIAYVGTTIQPAIRNWSMFYALAKRNDPHDSEFLKPEKIAEEEILFKRKVATANIDTVKYMTVAVQMVRQLPESRQEEWTQKIYSSFNGLIVREVLEHKDPARVAVVKSIPLNGIDIATFLETQKDILVTERDRLELVYNKLVSVSSNVMALIRSEEEAQQNSDIKEYVSSLREGISTAFSKEKAPASFNECVEYIAEVDELINKALKAGFKDIQISAPMILTDTEYMHKHGSDVHYLKK